MTQNEKPLAIATAVMMMAYTFVGFDTVGAEDYGRVVDGPLLVVFGLTFVPVLLLSGWVVWIRDMLRDAVVIGGFVGYALSFLFGIVIGLFSGAGVVESFFGSMFISSLFGVIFALPFILATVLIGAVAGYLARLIIRPQTS